MDRSGDESHDPVSSVVDIQEQTTDLKDTDNEGQSSTDDSEEAGNIPSECEDKYPWPYFDSPLEEVKTHPTRSEKRNACKSHVTMTNLPKLLDHQMDEIICAQKTDSTLRPLWHKAETDNGEYFVEKDLLWRNGKGVCEKEKCQLFVPIECRSTVLRLAHRPGHLGHDRTRAQILEHF